MQAAPMHVHTLHFTGVNELERSFAVVLESGFVEDCLVEPDALRLRFLAPPRRAAAVVERIYLHGGLRWCSRHRLRVEAGTAGNAGGA